jgi:hypothetical protein
MKPTLLTLVAALFVASSLFASAPATVTFSADGSYVLASSERINLTHEGEYWQLFQNNDPTPLHTIALKDGAWSTVKLIDPSVSTERAQVLQPIADLDAWMAQYQLTDVAQDVSESLTVEASFVSVPEKQSGTLLQMNYLLDGKGVARVQLEDHDASNNTEQLASLQTELNRRAPETVYDGDGELVGYRVAHAKAYRSAAGRLFIHSATTTSDWTPAADLPAGTDLVREGNAVHSTVTPGLTVVRIMR